MTDLNPYRGRYPVLRSRRVVWEEVARWVSARVGPVTDVLELGAGYCDFVNAYPAERRMAFDMNPEMAGCADEGVEFRCLDVTREWPVPLRSLDLVFASNFLEHLTVEDGRRLLERVYASLRPGGRLALLQPNFRLCPAHYFDDETHVAVYSDDGLAQALLDAGFFVERVEPGLLPFSMKSRLPKWRLLVRAYLSSPVKPAGAQMFLMGRRRS